MSLRTSDRCHWCGNPHPLVWNDNVYTSVRRKQPIPAEGDLLWALKNMCYMDMRQAEARRIMEIARRRDNVPVRITASMHDLIDRASNQNFVPVVDDKDAFIGIVKRSSIVQYCKQTLFAEDSSVRVPRYSPRRFRMGSA